MKLERHTRRYDVKVYYKAISCSCGGSYRTQIGHTLMMTDPPQMDFACDRCGRIERLTQEEFPHIQHDIVGEDL